MSERRPGQGEPPAPRAAEEPAEVDERGPIRWFARTSVAANLLLLVLVVGGLLSLPRLQQEVFPEVTLPRVIVEVPYPGATPEEVEQGVVLAIEEAVRGIDGVDEVRAVAAEGRAVVSVQLLLGADEQQLLNDVDSAVGRITSFPEDAEEPIVRLATNRRQVVSLIFSGSVPEESLRAIVERARDELLQDPRVTLVELSAVRPLEISVEVPREQLRRHGLTLPEVARRLGEASVQIPGGEVEGEGGEVLVRTAARREMAEELREVAVVAQPDGTRVLLGDIARVRDDFRDVDQAAWFDGRPAARVDVYRVGTQTPTEVSEAVNEYAERARAELPDGVEVAVWNDQTQIFRDRLDLLVRNGGLGLALVLCLLALFLQPRLAFWVTLGIPVSFLGSLLLLPSFDVSINLISLFAFIVTLGLVVDDAIVVGESIHYRREQGDEPLQAAIGGARAVARPVLFAITTTCLAFAPMLFVPGVAGKFFRNIPIVVILVLIASLLESLWVLPAHLAHPMPRPLAAALRPFEWVVSKLGGERLSRGLGWFVDRVYVPVARRAVRWRYLTVALGVALLMGTVGLWIGNRIAFTFMPKIQDDEVSATLELPVGTPTERTEEAMWRIEEAARRAAQTTDEGRGLLRGIFSQVGAPPRAAGEAIEAAQQGGGHVASVMVDLGPAGQRGVTSREFAERWREEIGEIAGADRLELSFTTGASAGPDIDLELSHDDRDQLHAAARRLAGELGRIAGVRDVDDGFTPGKEQLDFTLTPQGRALSLTERELAGQVRGAFFGAEAYRLQRGRNEVRVYARLPEEERASLEHVEDLVLSGPSGAEIPLMEAAHVRRTRADTAIQRKDMRRVAHVTANVHGEANANDVVAQLRQQAVPELRERFAGLSVEPAGQQESQQEALSSLFSGFAIALVAMFALLAVAFRSYLQPIAVLAAIPFGAVGAVGGHMLLGYDLSLMSVMGMVALAGVVVNDSLLLVVTVNELRARSRGEGGGARRDGEDLDEVLVAAGARRFRPILMTSLTTFLGLAPMIFETSVQARFLVPMALSLGFGILFATFVIVLIVPCLYRMLEDLKAASGRALDSVFGSERPEPAA